MFIIKQKNGTYLACQKVSGGNVVCSGASTFEDAVADCLSSLPEFNENNCEVCGKFDCICDNGFEEYRANREVSPVYLAHILKSDEKNY